MNDNDLKNDAQKVDIYRATTNLNVDIENPQININSAVGVNIKDVGSNNDVTNNFASISNLENANQGIYDLGIKGSMQAEHNTVTTENHFVPNSSDSEFNQLVTSSSDKVIYEPTLEEKKRKSQVFSIPKELKITIFIVFVLGIFILILPYIYDFFKNLQLAFTR